MRADFPGHLTMLSISLYYLFRRCTRISNAFTSDRRDLFKQKASQNSPGHRKNAVKGRKNSPPLAAMPYCIAANRAGVKARAAGGTCAAEAAAIIFARRNALMELAGRAK
jgi:hypothetical protein